MSLVERRQALKFQHRKLDKALSEERKRPQPDSIRLSAIKAEKLRIKDQIHALRTT
jgi:hypothetical protein